MGFNPIAKRVQRLRIAKSEIAKRAELDQNTVFRALSPEPCTLTSTQRKIEGVVVAEELELRDYLLDLHPLPASEQA